MAMKYVAAYLMVVLSGTDAPTKKQVEKTLSSVGIDVEDDIMDAFFKAVEGKTPHELIAAGMEKLQKVPSGGVAAAAAPAAGAADAGAGAAAKKEEEKKEEEEEEDDMGFSLFD
ncbi:ribosomal protein RPP2 [Toxoplasma gondii TgCatPRC2]|uniref:60S acidic ribosomal protein P2, putative n=15 Tax=Toxoplasma gondii TaxID=5811 RepID=B9PJK1_TOXGV|nr:ribosomal protein RPP2 [Toxoplasma gondii ME49]EPR60831.1 ribosomal protein RPP2 [Toxoplasma gondii GT1]ESS34786.1 ribosomal protein RPP2 [Toxoplasma gondii VEG]KAF4639159.1 ribosomal protein RPP2 [Toxoplasma gondii]KFG40695.1 ribosomal protein RPP2 [Toxoplasma gondii p89]KFG44651.1 ribosomal protein RPP2 [Toxoplasma gondii GAB2-2007-GAL-DOM2]KFG55748.1 ribosomal protein RPP2 [Toxoplasma gondii FOU]KFG57815.1 ribosomal protein RPP2 [Toxoplasma gondii RUB]KFH02475.1 ribosomal protein RPP2|eukprot:XP_008886505.1 ribosomal protein RPP2 [Hammondia hammondi]